MAKKKRKRNNHYNNHNNHNSKKKKKIKIKPKRFLGPKIVLAVLAGLITLGESKSCDLENLIKSESFPIQTRKAELTTKQIYKEWMSHYNKEGIYSDEIKNMSPTAAKILKKNKGLDQEAIHKIISTPFENFLKSVPKYEDFQNLFIGPACGEVESKSWLREAYQNLAKIDAFSGMDQIIKYTNDNKEKLNNLNDDDFAFCALNTAYFIIRRNFRPGEIFIYKKEDLNKAIINGIADCEIASAFTRDLYLYFIKAYNKKHLSKKVSIMTGCLLDKKKKISGLHAWLLFDNYEKKEIVETNGLEDAAILGTDYNSKRCFMKSTENSYLRSSFPSKFYIPFFSYIVKAGVNVNDYKELKKVHMFPEQIEKEIKQH